MAGICGACYRAVAYEDRCRTCMLCDDCCICDVAPTDEFDDDEFTKSELGEEE